MGKLTIIGNDKPVIGKQEMYSVSTINGWLNPLQPIKNPLQVPKPHWEVMVQTKTGWRKGGSDKEGQMVPYIFGQKSLFHKGIKIIVRQGEDYGELIVHPQRAKEAKITRVELLDANYKPIPKGKKLSYKDTIIARAYCVEMFEMNIAFTLWEDDAQGKGHDPLINAFNKINPVPVMGRVNEKGMAEAVFRLPFYTMAVMIANARTASGDKSEGATHEYYVTADVVSKHIQKASPNINVVNPTHNPEPPRKREVPKGHTPSPAKPKTTPAPEKPKPKPDGNSAKFPVTTGGKKSDDPEGKILSAEFVDGNGNRLHSSKVGTTVKIKITAKEMKGKKVKVKIWEEDNFTWSNDLIYEKDWVLAGDTSFIGVQLTKQMFDKAKEFGTDSSRQDYFIEVIHNDTSVKSAVMPVSADATPTEVPSGRSATMVKEPKQGKTPSSCICKEQYKDLIWGGKVSCEFRKKVVQIAKRLGKDPNLLMAGMALETGRTFSPTAGKGKNYVGLIQFGDSAAESVGTTRADLLKMTAIQQLDYVEKYLAKKKDKINTLTDFYLSILMPVDVGRGNQPNHVVFDNQYPLVYNKNGKLTDLSKSRHYGYRQNPSFLYEGKIHKNIKVKKSSGKVQAFKELYDEMKIWYENGENKYDGPGKTYIWEIEKNITKFYEEGKLNTAKTFECEKEKSETKPILDKGTWNIIITEQYTGNKCTHLEKTKVRSNCRRGKIFVYNHNQEIVLTIKDCLLEGIAGEDHMKTNADVPFGEFQINESTPFYSSDKENRESYGPHPRLVFEPIHGNNDEAAKSKRSAIRIHGGRQEGYEIKQLKRTQGCIRVWDSDAKALYDWWVGYKKSNPNVKPGKVTIKK
ncbi:L,D-transpeptidase [Chryseobacterium sp. c4a]|uniref:L,D-transpeptidase n=1 Tax=Chryseobacterium sp. c4a TaxID=1573582 RepID=UPI0013584A0D|nr:L,D-transpeptidase [Chryseobacterium sp. c4a]